MDNKKHQLKNNIEQQKKGLLRNTIDKFYTKDNIVELCGNIIKNKIKILDDDLIIEPSAGNGVFINMIKTLSHNYKFYDIEPDNNSEIIKQDYLNLKYEEFLKTHNMVHIIGNPPFGRQSSLAIKFIKKSCEFCNTISFILPKSFKKKSMHKYFPTNFHLIHEINLPEKSFLVNNIEYDVPCVFQIWEKKDTIRDIPINNEPINFKFVKKEETPDISFRRVGVNAGNISKNIDTKSFQSHYFIKFTKNKKIDEIITKLKNCNFSHDNTVGPKSISKQELIIEFNKLI